MSKKVSGRLTRQNLVLCLSALEGRRRLHSLILGIEEAMQESIEVRMKLFFFDSKILFLMYINCFRESQSVSFI